MNTSVYTINKGINKPVEFRGLKAQYIWYLGGGLIILLILFAILYICGINAFVCLGIIIISGTGLFMYVYKLSRKYEKRQNKRCAIRLRAIVKDEDGRVCFNGFTCNINTNGFGLFGATQGLEKGQLVVLEVTDLDNNRRPFADCEITYMKSHTVNKRQDYIGLKVLDIRGLTGQKSMEYILRLARCA